MVPVMGPGTVTFTPSLPAQQFHPFREALHQNVRSLCNSTRYHYSSGDACKHDADEIDQVGAGATGSVTCSLQPIEDH